jgi:hypothetical protein
MEDEAVIHNLERRPPKKDLFNMVEWFQRRKCENQPIMYIFIQKPVTYVILLIKIKLLFIFQLIWWGNAALLLALYVCYIFYS